MIRISLIVVFTTITVILSAFHSLPAFAAPQALAVLTTGNGAAMTCEKGVCTSNLSTYCLQQYRDAPDMGAPYHAGNPESFTVVLDMPDGTQKTIPSGDFLEFKAERGFVVVKAMMNENVLHDNGAIAARIIVGPTATLIPDPEEGDLNPFTQAEIALATGSYRIAGAHIIDATKQASTARALSVMLRAIPKWRGWPETTRDEMWQMIDGVAKKEQISGLEKDLIKSEFRACADLYENQKFYGIGYCIRQHHDEELVKMNKKYWKHQAGS